jgi:hydroxymethylglutaryl-CoA reductase (NADPH)
MQKKIHEMWEAKNQGSMLSGSIGNNAHAANVIAALFLATGQDLGHIGEGSQVFTTTEIITQPEEALYFSVFLADCMVGTVGGGTGLSTQKEALSLLGIAGGNAGNHAQQLAEIVATAVLAGEISLLASLAEGSLVQAHQHLGRGK